MDGVVWGWGADVYVVKLDGGGNLQWTRTIGGSKDDEGGSIIQTSDGGYAVAGSTMSFGAGWVDVYVVKLDGSGTVQWTRTIGGSSREEGNSIIQTSDGGYAVAGRTMSFGAGEVDVYVVKLDEDGNVNLGGCGSVSSGGVWAREVVQGLGVVFRLRPPLWGVGGSVGSGGTVNICVPLFVEGVGGSEGSEGSYVGRVGVVGGVRSDSCGGGGKPAWAVGGGGVRWVWAGGISGRRRGQSLYGWM